MIIMMKWSLCLSKTADTKGWLRRDFCYLFWKGKKKTTHKKPRVLTIECTISQHLWIRETTLSIGISPLSALPNETSGVVAAFVAALLSAPTSQT